MTDIIRHAGSRRRAYASRAAAAALGALLLAGCDDFDVRNINAPTEDNLTESPSRATLARTALGIQTQAFNDVGGEIQQFGIYGRELWNLLGNDPRETGEEIRGPQDPGGRAGGNWGGKYQAIRTTNSFLTALENTTVMTEAEKRASAGFAKTNKAWHLHRLAVRSGPTGLPIDVNRGINDEPAPLVSAADAMAEASRLLDEAYADLQAGGDVFPFTFVPGYTGFTTPATYAQFNRALAAKVLVHRATFADCGPCWAEAATAMSQSFVTTAGLPASLKTGVFYGYTGAANELTNPVSEAITSNRYWVHPSVVAGAQLRGNGQPDLRLTSKTREVPGGRELNELRATHKPVLYNSATDPTAPDVGADIPWMINEELLLLRAEIRWNTNERAGAIADLNLVREHAGGLAPTALTAGSPDDAFVTELLYNRLYSLMWTQGVRWVDARRYDRLGTLPLDRAGDVVHPHMLIPSAECDARDLPVPCSIGG